MWDGVVCKLVGEFFGSMCFYFIGDKKKMFLLFLFVVVISESYCISVLVVCVMYFDVGDFGVLNGVGLIVVLVCY